MEVQIPEMQVGDAVAFRGAGPLFKILSFLLGLFVPRWRRRKDKPWHLAFASKQVPEGWMLIEAVQGGVQELFHSTMELEGKTKAYRFLPEPATQEDIDKFKKTYLGFPYDAKAYIGTMILFLLQKVTRYRGRVVDNMHMCWETLSAWARSKGSPFQPNFEYPMIHKILDKLEGAGRKQIKHKATP